MKKEEKNQFVDSLIEKINNSGVIYLADVSELNAEKTSDLRRTCFKKDIELTMVKNTLLKRAMEQSNKNLDELYSVLKGPTSLMFSEIGNAPARLIKDFRKKNDRPFLKGAFVEEVAYLGDDQLEVLVNIKSRDELLGELIGLLQSPVKNVMSALQSGSQNLTGILKTLSNKEN